ncbi:hypothetical protein Pmani_034071 [Petrolisthes manimaculis]|uniref:Uncharacterized protein n=1 Tax=Petrolisthes manimaculis TaxID=1843537 RepID=A0AAE1TPT6_9EUCA|nr:hypothetical protein Pmani_034071 [Petrolisthes manimaculis]
MTWNFISSERECDPQTLNSGSAAALLCDETEYLYTSSLLLLSHTPHSLLFLSPFLYLSLPPPSSSPLSPCSLLLPSLSLSPLFIPSPPNNHYHPPPPPPPPTFDCFTCPYSTTT